MKKKSLSVKKKIHKSFLKYLKNSKINNLFKEFNNKLDILLNKEFRFAIAVSGGPDSLALAYLSKCYLLKSNSNLNLKCFIVDHKLRKESSIEAYSLKKFLSKFDINCEILTWKGKKPISNIQASARKHRYKLLKKACIKHNISNLITGHHKDDLYENFFIRMLRGSGLKGLTSFADPIVKIDDNFKILRPLIKVEKKELVHISKTVFNFFIKDPSNKNLNFQRSRIRKLISDLEKEGLDKKKLYLTINNLKSADLNIKIYVEDNIKKNTKYLRSSNQFILSQNFFLDHGNEVVFRSFAEVLKKISGKYYPPRGVKIRSAIQRCSSFDVKNKDTKNLKKSRDLKFTLGRCYIERINQTVIISREK